jgi:nicotinamidase/pyrazinamidase
MTIDQARAALIVVDVQNDFCPGGALAVPGGDAVVPMINELMGRFDLVVLTQDWHPRGHASFASSHTGANPYDLKAMPYGQQVLWPEHCVQDTEGAAFHAGLDVGRAHTIIRKGYNPAVDSYSAFFENDHTTATGLAGLLRAHGVEQLYVCGLALDYCVRYTAEDGTALGFAVSVIEDASRAIDLDGSLADTRISFKSAGIPLILSSAL